MKIINGIISLLQAVLLIAVIALQYLSDKKMGVERYLMFKKLTLSRDIFTPGVMTFYKIALILGIILGILCLIYILIKKANNFMMVNGVEIITLNFLAAVFVLSGKFQDMLAYEFFLIAICLILTLCYIKITIKLIIKRKN